MVNAKAIEEVEEIWPDEIAPLVSIAISLKRIADTLDGTSAGVCVTETIFGRRP